MLRGARAGNPPACSLAGSGVQAPVDGVEEQVGQREDHARVRVHQVAVADEQVHVLAHRALPAQAGPLRGPRRHLEGVGGQGRRRPGERGQLHVVVMETAVERHGLAGVEGGRDLKSSTKDSHRHLIGDNPPRRKRGV